MKRVVISGIGTEIPDEIISNEELVESFNAWVDLENPMRIARGEEPLARSDAEFIVYASGVQTRHVHTRDGILDPRRMTPRIPKRDDDALSVMAEFGAKAARKAIADAGIDAADIDMVICAASHQQRPYPAQAIEIQKELGTSGAAFDMSLGCSSAVAGLHVAFNLLRAGAHRRVLVVTPEIITGHLNFRDRQTHFIFGDAAAALLLEAVDDDEERSGRFEVIDTRGWTQFSNNIRTNFGFLNRAGLEDPSVVPMEGNMIKQVGNKVFKEVTVAGHRFIVDFLKEHGHSPQGIRRFWLHQANARMNAMILKLSFGHEVGHDRAPMVLSELGNTAAAGAVIALEQNHRDLEAGDVGLLCAFGAGYSIGGVLLRMM
ncbi:beta-ketoacyl-ACP synthase III [Aliihoeflea aestuarii]|jgi:beta-ketodecanoyl-[acyl-carrier-protein] synthase|uniref:beta-ketoacyl-ACP synthase III n=1 Tax=Aliihoeflea aestuarii TaxID=453840 RepID=UPI0020942AC2|nr:beta-ketoacyl-ACP synthase III [Aliihoeflea aestuarii]MCO6392223.1 beta-ketoacyl-ACP synthase III [Aliihoeflea aestuarii]